MKLTREQIIGFGSSIILCLLIVLILSLIFLRTEIRAEMGGIPVAFGTVEWASGTDEPASSGGGVDFFDVDPAGPDVIPNTAPFISQSPSASQTSSTDQPPIITQNTEQTIAIEAERQRKELEQRAEQERREAERKRLEEIRQRGEAINRQMSGAFGTGTTTGGNRGTAESGSGIQGSPQGNAAIGAYTGVGGTGSSGSGAGSGVGSYALTGRSLREGSTLPPPAYNIQEEGTIVVDITVNPQGDVISATVRPRGTNIDNAAMRQSATEAAKKAKFNNIGGTQNQIGTITYRYSLK